MSSTRPLYVHYNGVGMKVSSWVQDGDRIAIGTVIRGDKAADDVMTALQTDAGILQWDDEAPRTARVKDATQRTVGDGPRASHRIDLIVELGSPANADRAERTLEERVAALEQEVAELRRSLLATNRGERPQRPGAPTSNLTLIETETFEDA